MPPPDVEPADRAARRRVIRLAWASFFLIGWCGVLVPSLVRQIQGQFGVDDAAIGTWYLVNSGAYALSSFAGGLLTERFGRRTVLPAAAAAFGTGVLGCAVAPSWLLFLLAAVPMGGGAGAIDGGMNALVLAVTDGGRGRTLNLLHLFVGVGALGAPVVVGQVVDRGLPWQALLIATGAACLAIAFALRAVRMPSGRRSIAASPGAPRRAGNARTTVSIPLVLLAVAIGCYVAGEIGVSNWVVRFLADVPVSVATLGLSAFWGGLAVGRLGAAVVSDRFAHSAFAASAAIATGLATFAAVAAPTPELAILTLGLAGVASGPVFPMIVAIGGELQPDRLAATTGTLTGAAVIGGTVYPPLIGLTSATFGIAAGIAGAGVLSVACGLAILATRRFAAPTAPGALA